ncbi:cupin-2 domain-containing protein [Favolaschia claudopus]|uniref:Cupin-2 domain-containing protein n=1 Tax=Favolaschia claudopus TaxID=2862362 RepID=A0AAW0EI88_9AGAR
MASSRQLPQVQRVVTGHDNSGFGVVQNNSTLSFSSMDIPGMDGAKAAAVWVTTDGIPTKDNNLSEDGAERPVDGIVHPNGTNLRCTDLAPGAQTPMHRTTSLDYNILLQGELILIMEDGSETHLKNPGDTVIQKGTMHAWRNPSTEWARWMCAVIAAEPAVVNGKGLENETR